MVKKNYKGRNMWFCMNGRRVYGSREFPEFTILYLYYYPLSGNTATDYNLEASH